MASSATDNECPVCKDTIKNPSDPSPCCNKVFCQSCLIESTRVRQHCPHCRTPVPGHGGRTFRPDRIQHFRLPGLADDTFNAVRPVGSSIHDLLAQLRHANMQIAQMAFSADNQQAASVPAVQAAPRRRPTPRPRVRVRAAVAPIVPAINAYSINVISAPAAPLPPPPALFTGPPNLSTVITPNISSEIDEMAWRTEISLMENAPRQPSGPTVRTFSCPYCQQDGLDDLDLRDHCNDNHLGDTRRVVCPVCVSLPHGDPLYESRDFIGHLNLRHCYYISDITNVHQSDDVNLQAAILISLTEANQPVN